MSASTPDISPIQTRPAAAEPTIVTFGVSDPEVLLALSEYAEGPSRTNFLVTALKVGVLSLKAARGTLDADNVRREGERLMEQLTERLNGWREQLEGRVTGSLSHYFDPKQGLFMERVDRLTRHDGELSGVVKQQVSSRPCPGQPPPTITRRCCPGGSSSRADEAASRGHLSAGHFLPEFGGTGKGRGLLIAYVRNA